MDGTLVDSVGIHGEANRLALEMCGNGEPFSPSEHWSRYFKNINPNGAVRDYFKNTLKERGLSIAIDEFLNVLAQTKLEMLQDVKYKPGADKTVRFMKDKGALVGLVTSASMQEVGAIAKSYDIKHSEMPFSWFDFFVTRDDVRKIKPSPEPYNKVVGADWDGTYTAGVLVMEDLMVGVNSAMAAGISKENIVGIYDNHAKHETEKLKSSCGHFFSDHRKLLNYLEKSNS